MKKTTLTTWLLKLPIKFALISLAIILLLAFLYPTIGNWIYSTQQLPITPLFVLIGISILASAYYVATKAPRIKMDKTSFITIHNAQVLLLFLLFTASSYLLLSHQQDLLFKLMVLDTKITGATSIFILLTATFFLYLLGVELLNIYVKIRCMQNFKIPTWKIIFSIPFGFSALWIPGYLLNNKQPKTPSQQIKSKWYSKIINWTVANQLNTISMFVFITIVSAFFAGLNAMLLTFTFALLFGIWVMQIGTKQFEKNITKKYSSVAVIINIVLIITFSCFYIFTPQQTQNVQINISDVETITTQGQ